MAMPYSSVKPNNMTTSAARDLVKLLDESQFDLWESLVTDALRAAEQRGIERAALFLRDHKVVLEDNTWKIVDDPLTEENDLSPIQMAMILAIRALAQGGEN